MKKKIKTKRIGFIPKCRAATFAHKGTKRNKTRQQQNRKAINDG